MGVGGGECTSVRQDGSTFPMFLSVGPVKDADGNVGGSFGIGQDISEQKKRDLALRETNERLSVALQESERHARESAKLTELVDILQSCQSVEEAYKIVGSTLPNLLSCPAGALCMISSSRNVVEAVCTWGDEASTEKAFAPDACWALRRGKIHRVDDVTSPLRCAHVAAGSTGGYVCVPLALQGETLGILYLAKMSPSEVPFRDTRHGIAGWPRLGNQRTNLNGHR